MQANSRTVFAFSRDGGFPDRGLFCSLTDRKVPLASVWLIVCVCAVLGLFQFASATALLTIFRYASPCARCTANLWCLAYAPLLWTHLTPSRSPVSWSTGTTRKCPFDLDLSTLEEASSAELSTGSRCSGSLSSQSSSASLQWFRSRH